MFKPVDQKSTSQIETGPKGHLEITVAIKKNGKWVTPTLGKGQELQLREAIEALRQQGEMSKWESWQQFSKAGTVLQVSKEGIYVKGDVNRNLIDDTQIVEKSLKPEMLRTLKNVVTTFKNNLPKKLKAETLDTELQDERILQKLAGAGFLDKGDVVIEVRVVVPVKEQFDHRYQQESQAHNTLMKVNERLQSGQYGKAFLEYKGFEESEIVRMQSSMKALTEASDVVKRVMEETKRLLGLGNDKEAITYYTDAMPHYYDKYCTAFKEWEKEERLLTRKLHDKNPFKVDKQGIRFQLDVAAELFLFAEQNMPRRINTTEAMKKLASVHVDYVNSSKVRISFEEQANTLLENEKKFNGQIAKAVEALGDRDFIDEAMKGWLPKDIEVYKKKLETLKKESDKVLDILEKAADALQTGFIQQGVDEYSTKMIERYAWYVDACNNLILEQNLAKGRNLGEGWAPFSLDLNHPAIHQKFLETMSKEAKRHQGLNPEKWNLGLEKMRPYTVGLTEVLDRPQLQKTLMEFHAKRQNWTKSLGEFVERYIENYFDFQRIMLKHGIDHLRSAFLFNHYVAAYEALREWDASFQKVIDLSNQEKYAEAMQAYASLVEADFPALATKLANANFIVGQINDKDDTRVREAFIEFGELMGLKGPQQMLELQAPFFLPAIAPEHLIVFDDCVKKHFGDDAPTETIKRAQNVMRDTLRKVNENFDAGKFKRFFQKDVLSDFFKIPQIDSASKKILEKNGWSPKQIKAMNAWANDYAAFIRPLKEGEQAVASESDPQNKRALKAQLKELAYKMRPTALKLQHEFMRLGGPAQILKLRESVNEIVRARVDGIEELTQEKAQEEEAFALPLIEGSASFFTLMQDRTSYYRTLCLDLGIFAEWEPVEQTLLGGAYGRDPKFLSHLEKAGWNRVEIQKLGKWYDSYMRLAMPLQMTRNELEADPENVTLQRKWKKLAGNQIPKLNALARQFNKQGGLKKVQELEKALKKWSEAQLTRRISKEMNASLIAFSSFNISDTIKKTNDEIGRQQRLTRVPMSWDSDFLKILTSRTSPLLGAVRGPKKTPIWELLLKHYKLTNREVGNIVKLHQNYQIALKKLVEVERKLEAHPEDNDLLASLVKEMQAQRAKLITLGKQYRAMESKIVQLQGALIEFKDQLIDLQKKQPKDEEIAGLSNKELANLIALTRNLNVLKAFEDKRSFMMETYNRFSRKR